MAELARTGFRGTSQVASTALTAACELVLPGVLLGDEELQRSWHGPLLDARVTLVPASSAPQDRLEAQLVLADEAHVQQALNWQSAFATIVVVTSRMNEAMASRLICPSFVILPPPTCELARRVAARWLADRARHFHHRARNMRHCQLSPNVRVNLSERVLLACGETITLGSGEASILRHLYENRGTWISTTQLRHEVFGRTDEAAAKLVWKYISTLRKKLGEHSHVLEMDRTRGYRLVVPLLED